MTEEVRYAQYSDDFDEEDDDFEEEYIEEFGGDYDDSYHNYDPVKTTPAYHIQQAERALEQLKFVVEESGWKKAHTVRGGAAIYSKNGIEDNDKVPVYMCEHVIDGFAPQPIFAVIGMRKLWDPWYEEGNLVENLNDTTSLTYMVMNGVAGVRTRDLSLVEKIECLSDGTIYFVSTSVITDKVPRVADKVRAHLHLNGWILKPIALNPPRTKITYILQTKVNGWVPSIVAKKYLIKRPLVVHTIDRYLQKNGPPPMVISSTPSDSSYPSRSVSGSSSVHLPISTGNVNNVDRKSKIRNNKSIIVQHPLQNGRPQTQYTTGEPPVHSSEEDKEPSSSLSSPPLSPSSPKQATFQQKTISNQPSSIPVQESTSVKHRSIKPTTPVQVQPTSTQIDSPVVPTILTFTPPPPPQHKPQLTKKKHRHTDALNRAVANFKDNAKSSDGWNFHSENKGVKIYTKIIEGRTNPATRGEYTIIGNYTASDFLAAAKNSNLRKTWDDRYEDGVDLEILNKDEVLTRTTLKGTFPISARDLALVGTVEHDPETGRIIYVTTSIIDPAIPEVKKCVRANLVYTGWQIDPKLDFNGNTKALNIIYIVDIDIKLDSVPTSILRSISSGTPMVLYHLDESLRKIGFPPYVLNSTSLVLSEKIDPKTFEYDLSLIAENDGIAVIRLSKTMYPNGFDISVTPENTKVELLSDTSVNIRITLPSEVLTEELQIKITRYTSNGFKMTYNGVNEIPLAPKETSPKVLEKVKPEPTFATKDVKSTRLSGFPKKTISRSVELSKETETSRSAEIPKETETSRSVELPKETETSRSVELPKEAETSRSVELPKETETLRSLEISKETGTVESSLRQRHSRRPSQSILINSINYSTIVTEDDRSPRKQKRLSFANSPPSIINSESFKPEEEKKTIERVATPKLTPSDDEYNKYEAAIREIEELEAMKEMDSTASVGSHIEYPVNKFDITKDIISLTDNVKFNSYQAGLMFLAMLLAYYAGKLSHSKI